MKGAQGLMRRVGGGGGGGVRGHLTHIRVHTTHNPQKEKKLKGLKYPKILNTVQGNTTYFRYLLFRTT